MTLMTNGSKSVISGVSERSNCYRSYSNVTSSLCYFSYVLDLNHLMTLTKNGKTAKMLKRLLDCTRAR